MAALAVKMTAVCSGSETFSWRNSFDDKPSTLIKGRKTISTPYFSAMSKYGDLSEEGFGRETNILLIFTLG